MTTIVNTPPSGGDDSGSGLGIILGVIVALILVALFFIYALPAIRDSMTPKNGSIDVNVKVSTSSLSY